MKLFHKMQMCGFSLFGGLFRRIAHDAVIRLYDVFVIVSTNDAGKPVPYLQNEDEYQVIDAHKGILA